MRKNLVTGILLAVVLLSQGCALICDGSRSDVRFTSNPSGAHIVAGDVQGTTPVTLKVSKKVTCATFSYQGYTTKTVEYKRSFQAGYLVCSIFMFGLLGVAVDGATGAWYKLPPEVQCDLSPAARGTNGITELTRKFRVPRQYIRLAMLQ
ncbi:MAG: hypothetical protein RDV41_10170 [Planctomycetota bacterium]|nr:hypothetical protein [Planctomycetota bacterium]